MDDIVERLKATLRIEQVIDQDGYPLVNHGRYRKCTQHDSLVVDAAEQAYFWNSKGEAGDVITWVQQRRGVDFKTAVEELCRRANIPEPEWGKQDARTRLATRAKEDALDVAARVFEKWMWKDIQALGYARSRGWNDETLRSGRVGYSGEGTPAERKELEGELSLAGVDLKSPAAVSIMGFKGDVKSWAEKHEVDQIPSHWIDQGYIPGMIGNGRLVYPHVRGGRVQYLSGRGIEKKMHYNLPECLVGSRQMYFNSAYNPQAGAVVIVEGQADAISLSQWSVAAIAMAGVSMDDWVMQVIKGHTSVYVGMDADKAGKTADWKIARALGPMVRVIHWPGDDVKDANDLLKRLIQDGADQDQQVKGLMLLMEQSKTFVEEICMWAGEQEGAAKDANFAQNITW